MPRPGEGNTPRSLAFKDYANDMLSRGAKVVHVKAILSSYLIKDFLPQYKVDVEVRYEFTPGVDPVDPIYTVLTAGPLDKLDSDPKTVLNNDARYKGKYSYIR